MKHCAKNTTTLPNASNLWWTITSKLGRVSYCSLVLIYRYHRWKCMRILFPCPKFFSVKGPLLIISPIIQYIPRNMHTVFALLCFVVVIHWLIFPISIRLTSLALWQSNDCPSASKANLMNMDKYFMWIHYERLHNHNKAKHSKTVCIFLGIYCMSMCLLVCALIQCWSRLFGLVNEDQIKHVISLSFISI